MQMMKEKTSSMLKILAVLCFLLSLSACASAPASSVPLLESLDGQIWYLDAEATAKVNEKVRNDMARRGLEEFINIFGDMYFRLNLASSSFTIGSAKGISDTARFTIVSQNAEQAQLLSSDNRTDKFKIIFTLQGDVLIVRMFAEEDVEKATAFHRPQAGVEPPALIAKARETINWYVLTNYGWRRDVYSAELYPQATQSSDVISFLVTHQDDQNPAAPGGDKSFVLELDRQTLDVVRETGF